MAEAVSAPIVTPAPATPAAGAPVAATPAATARTLKLKVDGQDMEMSEAEVISLAQQGKSAAKRFQEAAAAKREAQDIVNFLKSNPKQAFQKLGIDVRKFSEDTLMEIIQHEKMSPEQKDAFAAKQELARYKEQEKTLAERQAAEKRQAAEQNQMKFFDEVFTKALTSQGVPKTPYTIQRMATLMMVANKKGLPIDSEKIASLVREDYQREHNSLLQGLEGDALLNFFSKDVLKRISKAQVKNYRAKGGTTVATKTVKTTETPANPVNAWKEFQRKNRGY